MIIGGIAVNKINSKNIATGGSVTGGIAISKIITSKVATGGVITGGIAITDDSLIISTGGMTTGGSATAIAKYHKTSSGGTTTGGSATIRIIASKTASGGIIVGGIAKFVTIVIKTASGGMITGGKIRRADTPHIGGGAKTGGAARSTANIHLVGHGGAKTGGYAVSPFRDYRVGTGGVRTFGKANVSRYGNPPTRTQSGIGRCITGNILAAIPKPQSKLLRTIPVPPAIINPRTEIDGVWCPVKDGCSGVLPQVVVKRQKGYTPNPLGTKAPRDRGIASSS